MSDVIEHSDEVGIDGHDHIQVKAHQDEDDRSHNDWVRFELFPLEVVVLGLEGLEGHSDFPSVEDWADSPEGGKDSHPDEIFPNEGKIHRKYCHQKHWYKYAHVAKDSHFLEECVLIIGKCYFLIWIFYHDWHSIELTDDHQAIPYLEDQCESVYEGQDGQGRKEYQREGYDHHHCPHHIYSTLNVILIPEALE